VFPTSRKLALLSVIITDCASHMICSSCTKIKTVPNILLLQLPSIFCALVCTDRVSLGLCSEVFFPNVLANSLIFFVMYVN
jgi:hypothetical protein